MIDIFGNYLFTIWLTDNRYVYWEKNKTSPSQVDSNMNHLWAFSLFTLCHIAIHIESFNNCILLSIFSCYLHYFSKWAQSDIDYINTSPRPAVVSSYTVNCLDFLICIFLQIEPSNPLTSIYNSSSKLHSPIEIP
jgi:hypothetical protein